jgi:2-C-methyl-D-erythritol 4-phosphate cytidylyltransferase
MGGVRKPLLELCGEPVLLWAVRPFLSLTEVKALVVALPQELAAAPPAWLTGIDPRVRIAVGGETRRHSVWNAIQALPSAVNLIAVHDAARPLIDSETIRRCIHAARTGESAVAGIPVTDTLKRVDDVQRVVETPDRSTLWQAQTPQVFPRDLLVEAYRKADEGDWPATDDASLVERIGGTVRMVEASPHNMKLTRTEDLALVEALLERQA